MIRSVYDTKDTVERNMSTSSSPLNGRIVDGTSDMPISLDTCTPVSDASNVECIDLTGSNNAEQSAAVRTVAMPVARGRPFNAISIQGVMQFDDDDVDLSDSSEDEQEIEPSLTQHQPNATGTLTVAAAVGSATVAQRPPPVPVDPAPVPPPVAAAQPSVLAQNIAVAVQQRLGGPPDRRRSARIAQMSNEKQVIKRLVKRRAVNSDGASTSSGSDPAMAGGIAVSDGAASSSAIPPPEAAVTFVAGSSRPSTSNNVQADDEQPDCCAICLLAFKDLKKTVGLASFQCGHVFCKKCIENLFIQAMPRPDEHVCRKCRRNDALCPKCRIVVTKKNVTSIYF